MSTAGSSPVVGFLDAVPATEEELQALAHSILPSSCAEDDPVSHSLVQRISQAAPGENTLQVSLQTTATLSCNDEAPSTKNPPQQQSKPPSLFTVGNPDTFSKHKPMLPPVRSTRGSDTDSNLESVVAAYADPPPIALSRHSSSKRSFINLLTRQGSRNSQRSLLPIAGTESKNKVVPDPNTGPSHGGNGGDSPSNAPSPGPSRRGSMATESEMTRRRSSFMSSVNVLAQNVTESISKLFTTEDTTEYQRRQTKVAELVNNQVLLINAAQIAHMQKQSAHFLTISVFSPFRKWWDLLFTLCVVHVSLVCPVQIGFNVHRSSGFVHIVDLFIDLLYLMEIGLNSLTSFIDETTGVEVKQLSTIRQHYLHSLSFALDVLSCVPSEWLVYFVAIPTPLWNILKLLKILRVVNLSQREIFKAITRRLNNVTNPSMIRMLELGAIFSLSQHYIGCSYYFISRTQVEATSWTPASLHGDDTLTVKYIDAIYFAIMVTTANDVGPTNSKEKLFTSVMLLLGIVINASIIGSAANLLSNLDKSQTDRKNQLDAIHEFLRFKKVPPKLQDQIRRYYEYYLSGRLENPMENMFGHLPDRLKLALKMNLYNSFVSKVALFKACSTEGVIAIVQCMTPIVVMPNDLIVRIGEIGLEFYFIKSGTVNLTIGCHDLGEDPVSLGVLSEGSFFGEASILTDGPSSANVIAVSITELMCITKSDFLKIAKKFPTFYMAIKRISDSRLKNAKKVEQQQSKTRSSSLLHDDSDRQPSADPRTNSRLTSSRTSSRGTSRTTPSVIIHPKKKSSMIGHKLSTSSAGRAAEAASNKSKEMTRKIMTKARTFRARFSATSLGADSRFFERISLAHARRLAQDRALDNVGPIIEEGQQDCCT